MRSPLLYAAKLQEVFAATSAVQLLAQLLNMLEMPRLCLKAADGIHRQLVNNLVVAPMSFFHTTPLGRCDGAVAVDASATWLLAGLHLVASFPTHRCLLLPFCCMLHQDRESTDQGHIRCG